MLVCTRAILFAFLFVGPLAVRADVVVRIADRGAATTTEVDVAFDPQQRIAVAYGRAEEPGVRLARLACGVDRFALNDVASPPMFLGLAIDPFGLVGVAHDMSGDGLPPGLRFSIEAADWGSSTVQIAGSEGGRRPSYAVDSTGRPYVVFVQPRGSLAVALFDVIAGKWRVEEVAAPRPSFYSDPFLSIAVNRQDRPVVAYRDEKSRLTVVTRSDIGWSYRTTPAQGSLTLVGGVAVVCDSADAPLVACGLGDELRLYRFNLLSVTQQTISAAVRPVLGPNALAIDPAGVLTVAFYDGFRREMDVARNQLGWVVTPFDSVSLETRPAVALDADRRWVAAYVDHRLLKVAGTSLRLLPAADLDCDRDVDADDMRAFAPCGTGPGVPYDPAALPGDCPFVPNNEGRIPPDFDEDGDVDQWDFSLIQRCAGPSGQPPRPSCEE